MLVVAFQVVPACREGDEGVFGLPTQYLGAFHLQPQPGALRAPGRHGGAIQLGLLGRQGGVHQVVDQAQHVGAVARTHQGLGVRCRGAAVIVPTAGVEQVAAAAGADRDTHPVTTSTCRSFQGWPRTDGGEVGGQA